MSKRYRETYVEINLENLYENYKNVSEIDKRVKIIPVVKANAYGHGVIPVVDYLVSRGVDQFSVSLLEEALEIRNKFPNIDILVMGVVNRNGVLISSEKDIALTISNFDQIENLSFLTKKLKIHLKVDTGMNRLGFKTIDDIQKAISLLKSNDLVDIVGIYTHFSTADVDKTYYDIQLNKFKTVVDSIDYEFNMVHMSNSSSIIKYEQNYAFTTHARLGISLYGLTLDDNVNFLKETFRLITRVSEIKELSPGDKVGYGATYTAQQKELVGILPIGYADGFLRNNRDGDVEINGKRYKIVGNICMDQMFIKIDEDVKKTDDVVLFGGIVSIDEVAKRLNTINYEVICQITSRVPRKYIK